MGLDFSLSGFVGAGGGLAYVLVALLWAASHGRRRQRLLFAGLVGAQGISVVLQSLTTPEQSGPVTFAAIAGPYLVGAAGLFTIGFAAVLALTLARQTSRRAVLTVGGALAVLAVMGAAFLAQGGVTPGKGDPAAMPAFTRIVFVVILVGYAASAAAVLAMALHWKVHAGRGTAVLAAATGILPVGYLTALATRSPAETLLAAFGIGCVLAWLPPWGKGDPRVGRSVLLGLLAWALVMEVLNFLPLLRGLFGAVFSPFEVAAALGMAIALLRYHAWGILPPRFAERRGTLAAGALAVLFIVAQVAQEFFAAEYGLLMGGVVAGALLFAANPLQRAMERMAGHETPSTRAAGAPARATAAGDVAEREQAYRDAVNLALRDRTLTRDEERRLLRLAYHLGVPTPRAMEIHDEIERERDPEEVAR